MDSLELFMMRKTFHSIFLRRLEIINYVALFFHISENTEFPRGSLIKIQRTRGVILIRNFELFQKNLKKFKINYHG